ncbi:MAG: hypothetical protein HYW24_01935 [Candidatus Aenigmarchaeota archaeon]|nr:hypothetical protein [Candidatus Aenigmarchaeota archaeon]
MVSSETLLLIISVIFVSFLPWISKASDMWTKIKRWYPLLLAGLFMGIGAVGLRIFARGVASSIVSNFQFYTLVELFFESGAALLGAIAILGIMKNILLNK